MKIFLLGANGQVGWELQRSLAPLGAIMACNRHSGNLENLDDLSTLIRDYCPEIIVNAAAYTAVDNAESEPEKAYQINTKAVDFLAQEAKQLNAWFIHYSTDYVFDGDKKGVYLENDTPNPQSVYGQTKFAAEEAIKKSQCQHLIFRTAWVYSLRGANFVKTIIRLAKEREELKIVTDQIGAPTSAELIADVTALCLYKIAQNKNTLSNLIGLYHLTPEGETSWHGFAQFIIAELAGMGVEFRANFENIVPISTSEFPLPAKRPANSLLETKIICRTFNLKLPQWQFHAQRLLKELFSQQAI
ncbi:MAG TPA: dTDP-4-dehydrorhamnose reductase [Deltaproteobacteria bacterium]|nr:dTDP-4-dehydrorhamnose reductase [Deltaproteobacteria bacterium]